MTNPNGNVVVVHENNNNNNPSPSSRGWLCSRCTLQNMWRRRHCEVCGQRRPTGLTTMGQPLPNSNSIDGTCLRDDMDASTAAAAAAASTGRLANNKGVDNNNTTGQQPETVVLVAKKRRLLLEDHPMRRRRIDQDDPTRQHPMVKITKKQTTTTTGQDILALEVDCANRSTMIPTSGDDDDSAAGAAAAAASWPVDPDPRTAPIPMTSSSVAAAAATTTSTTTETSIWALGPPTAKTIKSTTPVVTNTSSARGNANDSTHTLGEERTEDPETGRRFAEDRAHIHTSGAGYDDATAVMGRGGGDDDPASLLCLSSLQQAPESSSNERIQPITACADEDVESKCRALERDNQYLRQALDATNQLLQNALQFIIHQRAATAAAAAEVVTRQSAPSRNAAHAGMLPAGQMDDILFVWSRSQEELSALPPRAPKPQKRPDQQKADAEYQSTGTVAVGTVDRIHERYQVSRAACGSFIRNNTDHTGKPVLPTPQCTLVDDQDTASTWLPAGDRDLVMDPATTMAARATYDITDRQGSVGPNQVEGPDNATTILTKLPASPAGSTRVLDPAMTVAGRATNTADGKGSVGPNQVEGPDNATTPAKLPTSPAGSTQTIDPDEAAHCLHIRQNINATSKVRPLSPGGNRLGKEQDSAADGPLKGSGRRVTMSESKTNVYPVATVTEPDNATTTKNKPTKSQRVQPLQESTNQQTAATVNPYKRWRTTPMATSQCGLELGQAKSVDKVVNTNEEVASSTNPAEITNTRTTNGTSRKPWLTARSSKSQRYTSADQLWDESQQPRQHRRQQQHHNQRPQQRQRSNASSKSSLSPTSYPYCEVVRNKYERSKLRSHALDCCRPFHEFCYETGHYDGSQDPVQQFGRHRARHTPPSTPEGFWELDFIDEMDDNKGKPGSKPGKQNPN